MPTSAAYSGSPQVFNQNQDITWIATEHQIDIYAAFSLAATVLSTPSYAAQAANLATAILGLLWDDSTNRFNQGYDPGTGPDTGDPLDLHSWGASFLIQLGGQSAKVNSILSPDALAPFVVSNEAATGFAPDYSSDPSGEYRGALPAIWTEGSAGLAQAFARAGNLDGRFLEPRSGPRSSRWRTWVLRSRAAQAL